MSALGVRMLMFWFGAAFFFGVAIAPWAPTWLRVLGVLFAVTDQALLTMALIEWREEINRER